MLSCSVVLLLVVTAGTAQGDLSNDNFANAQDLGSGLTASATGSNVAATKEAGEPNHAGDAGGASVWYRWTAPTSGQIRIHVCNSDFDTLLAVYTGSSVDSLTPIASNDQGCGNQSRVVFNAVAGTTYRIAVDGWSNAGTTTPAQGTIKLELGPPSPPANDNFANAADLGSSTNISISGSSLDATKQVGEPNHAGDSGGASVWYTWTALSAGRIKIDTCDSGFDTLLAVYTGPTLALLNPVASNDQACGSKSKVAFDVVPGTTYRIAVDGFSANGAQPPDQGRIELNLQEARPPANDNFANATDLGSVSATTFGVDSRDATKESGEPNHAGDPGGASVWYRWTAPSSGPVRLNACDSFFAYDTLIGVYTGSGVNALSTVSSNNDACAFGLSRLVFIATAGTTYRIAVDGFSHAGTQAPEEGFVNVDLKVLHPPANDDFANALDLGAQANLSLSGTNVDATKETNEPYAYVAQSDPTHDEPGGTSVWYRWMAPSSGLFTVDLCDSNFDTELAVFTGSTLTGLTRVANSDNGCSSSSRASALAFQATAGTTYRIDVDGSTAHYFQPPEEGAIGLKIYPTQSNPSSPPPTSPTGGSSTVIPAQTPAAGCKRARKHKKRHGKPKCVKG
jgi:hypothetical protein